MNLAFRSFSFFAWLLLLVAFAIPANGAVPDNDLTDLIVNSGFEEQFDGWNDIDPSSISGVARSGSSSAKISGSAGKISQSVAVLPNTEYELSVYIRDTGQLRASVDGVDYSAIGGGEGEFEKVAVQFNSGAADLLEIWLEYGGEECRFDDLELWEITSNNNQDYREQLVVQSVSATSHDGNVPENTIDSDLDTRWSANGVGEFITFDLGSPQAISAVDVAWYHGDTRVAMYQIFVGNNFKNLTEVLIGKSSGSTLELESNTFEEIHGRFVRIVGLGNSSNSWNSITEVEIFGNPDTGHAQENPALGPMLSFQPELQQQHQFPTDLIPDLVLWKITLPVDENGNDSSGVSDVDDRNRDAHEVRDSNLNNFEYMPWFHAQNDEVVFRAHCAGATTQGSYYPRSELRQRVGGGDNYWSMNQYQYLETELRVTEVPFEKPEVSVVQIHGPEDEPLRVQYLAGTGVYIVWNESNNTKNKPLPYALGQRLLIKVTVDQGDITCLITNLDTNETFTKTWTSADATGYFKVGCYTQSSIFLSQFKPGQNDEPLDAAGEVRVKNITLIENY